MPTATFSPLGHEEDGGSPAPGELELARSFLSLHDHVRGDPDSLPPSAATIERWLRDHELIDRQPSSEDLSSAAATLEALRTLVNETEGAARDVDASDRIDRAALDARLTPSVARARLESTAPGVAGALGAVLAAAFLARLDGSWERLRNCSNRRCRSVFFDRSKNRSGRWCSMRSCGNQAKVRAYRERHRASAP